MEDLSYRSDLGLGLQVFPCGKIDSFIFGFYAINRQGQADLQPEKWSEIMCLDVGGGKTPPFFLAHLFRGTFNTKVSEFDFWSSHSLM